MRILIHRVARGALALAFAVALAGCGLAEGTNGGHAAQPAAPPQANPGESQGTVTGGGESPPLQPAQTPTQAIERFAGLYINWSYRTLQANERELAAMAVGEARQAELAAAAAAAHDSVIAQGHVYNSGSVVAIGALLGAGTDQYALVTKEQTGGGQEYAGLPAAFHVTLVTVSSAATGWSVSQWQPVS